MDMPKRWNDAVALMRAQVEHRLKTYGGNLVTTNWGIVAGFYCSHAGAISNLLILVDGKRAPQGGYTIGRDTMERNAGWYLIDSLPTQFLGRIVDEVEAEEWYVTGGRGEVGGDTKAKEERLRKRAEALSLKMARIEAEEEKWWADLRGAFKPINGETSLADQSSSNNW